MRIASCRSFKSEDDQPLLARQCRHRTESCARLASNRQQQQPINVDWRAHKRSLTAACVRQQCIDCDRNGWKAATKVVAVFPELEIWRQDFDQPMPVPNFPRHPRPDGKGEVERIHIVTGFKKLVTMCHSLPVKKAKAIDPFRFCLGVL